MNKGVQFRLQILDSIDVHGDNLNRRDFPFTVQLSNEGDSFEIEFGHRNEYSIEGCCDKPAIGSIHTGSKNLTCLSVGEFGIPHGGPIR